MKSKMFINLVKSIVKSTEFNLNNADKLDVVRSAFTAGAVKASAQALRDLGYDVDHGDWEDRGCLRVGYVRIGSQTIVKNSVIDYRAVEKLFKDCPGSTEEILAAVREEAERMVREAKSESGKLAWYFTHCGEIEMCRFLGLISEDRRHELEAEWKKLHP